LPAAFASREFLEALDAADAIVLCPSNPLVSLGPILALDGIREKVAAKPSAAVTPLIGGQAVKGPLAKMLRELGREPTAVEAARDLRGSARGFVLDRNDSQLAADIETLGFHVALADTLMTDDAGRKNLALNVLRFIQTDRAE
jgi:LPPG:FO 2-phospho-L-lactate transferase